MRVNQAACDEIDHRMWLRGEGWVCDDRPLELDKLMTAAEIADRFGLKVHNIRDWARRHPDKITKHQNGGRVLFSPRQVLRFQNTLMA